MGLEVSESRTGVTPLAVSCDPGPSASARANAALSHATTESIARHGAPRAAHVPSRMRHHVPANVELLVHLDVLNSAAAVQRVRHGAASVSEVLRYRSRLYHSQGIVCLF